MMLASTFLDMVLGLDIHFEVMPFPPTPLPIPNPFVGMVWDPGGLLTSQAMGLAMALVRGQAPTGPVLINSMPGTTVGTNAKNSLGVPHILMPPGVSWAPMPKMPKPSFKGPPPLPGPPVAPEGDAICVFGSPTVTLMGTSAVRMGDKSMSCGEPIRLPSSTVLAIPKGLPVMIGGPPAISLSDAIGALLKTKWLAGPLHDLLSRMKPGRLRNLLTKAVCFLTGHPVDVATGRVLTDQVDWELPGPMPLKFERNYSSAWANRTGPLGHGWSHTLDQAVWAERGRVVYLDGEGREIEFDTFDEPDHVLRPGQSRWEPISRLTLTALGHRRYEIKTTQGVTHHFAPVDGVTGARKHWSPLVRIENRGGDAIQLDYDRRGCLEWVTDSAGRQIAFEHDREGRLLTTKLPHPTEAGWLPHTRYAYDREGDLVEATDPLGHSWRFKYKQHLLMQETNRNGLSFYFAYDGYGEDAYCVRTWGDGGIYDHVIDYDKLGKVTSVTNSLGHTTTYKMNAVGCVTQVIDALGGVTAYEYDERSLQKVKETDPVGGATAWQFDPRGNCTNTIAPDGATVSFEFNHHNQPIRAIDAMNGEWQWGYDDRGHMVGRINPLNQRLTFDWRTQTPDLGEARRSSTPTRQPSGPRRLLGYTDATGQHTAFTYDPQCNLVSMQSPGHVESRWSYDRRGQSTAIFDAKNNARRRERDVLGRIVRAFEPDGNIRELSYDAEGNLLRARDTQNDVHFVYNGMGRPSSRTQGGSTIRFEYDTEERLRYITNEQGHVYRFDLGPTGRVATETLFGGRTRRYTYDPAGRVDRLLLPDGQESKYSYDSAGRVAGIEHSDGNHEHYSYRLDGELVQAENREGLLVLERDPLGRVIKESFGHDWITSQRDSSGMRVRVRSSRGLDQRITRNSAGRMVRVLATMNQAAGTSRKEPQCETSWEVGIKRDVLGLELERSLPGGIQTRWERDNLGRPTKHETFSSGAFRGLFSMPGT